jgi:hypothetical protein
VALTTGLSYNGTIAGTASYIQQIAEMAVVDQNDVNYQAILPMMISYAENRMYRDLDFLFTSTSITGYAITAGSRQINIPQGTIVVTEQLNLITPSGVSSPDAGTRVPLLPTTKEYLDAVYGSSQYTDQPQYYTAFNDNLFYVGPFSDATYYVEIVGTYRPQSLSLTNPTTFISLYLPDVFIMASMVYISAYQRNFGRQSDDPQMAQSYETQYQALLKGATIEEARKKYESAAWSSQSPAVVASPTRG